MLATANSETLGETLAFKSHTAVGSMLEGSNQLALESNPGFQVNDTIIIAVGGESGAGARGTKGVGGTWPALSYSTIQAMNADTSRVNNTYAWVEATGDVYRCSSSKWSQVPASRYYTAKVIPRALVGKITRIDGLVLTLTTRASATARNARIHYDNASTLNAIGDQLSGHTPAANTLRIPAGSFAVSTRLSIHSHHGWTVCGAGKDTSEIFSPAGCPSAMLQFTACTGMVARDFAIRGNARLHGFALAWWTTYPAVTELTVTQGDGYPRGLFFRSCSGCYAKRVKVTDAFQQALGAAFCKHVWAIDCEVYVSEAIPQYIQWQILWSDSDGGGTIDCSVSSTYLTGGAEIFRSNGVHFIRTKLINAGMSCNGAGRFLLDEPTIIVRAMSQYSDEAWSEYNPLINMNTNIKPIPDYVREGGVIRNPRITIEGYINNGNDLPQGITVNAKNERISIIGGYPHSPELGGLIDYQVNHAPPGNPLSCAGVVNDNAEQLLVDGIRVIGTTANKSTFNINNARASGIVRNCVADRIGGNAAQANNQSNAEYRLPGPTSSR